MDENQIQAIADEVIAALEKLAPGGTNWWEPWGAFGSYATLLAAIVAFIIGWLTLRHQKKALKDQLESAETALNKQLLASSDALKEQLAAAKEALGQKTDADSKNLEQKSEADARNLAQKQEADARSEWWRRTQWALEASISDDEVMSDYGAALLDVLSESDLAGPEEAAMLDTVWQGSGTQMRGNSILLLLDDAGNMDLLTEEQEEELERLEQSSNDLDEESEARVGDHEEHLGTDPDDVGSDPEGQTSGQLAGNMDDSQDTSDNGGNKEDDDELSQDVRPK